MVRYIGSIVCWVETLNPVVLVHSHFNFIHIIKSKYWTLTTKHLSELWSVRNMRKQIMQIVVVLSIRTSFLKYMSLQNPLYLLAKIILHLEGSIKQETVVLLIPFLQASYMYIQCPSTQNR